MIDLEYFLITVFNAPERNLLGNISAVFLLDHPISDETCQRIANDLNQPATTFIWKAQDEWHIRWFAPDQEIQLCGHGTMAAIALFDHLGKVPPTFHYRKGTVSGTVDTSGIATILKAGTFEKSSAPEGLEEALGVVIGEYYATNDKDIVVLKNQQEVQTLQPNFDALKKLEPFGYAVTAKGDEVDFVSRTLVPKVQQLEDHATGSSHTVLVPYWSKVLSKNELKAEQLSPRGGAFICSLNSPEVALKGNYQVVSKGNYKLKNIV